MSTAVRRIIDGVLSASAVGLTLICAPAAQATPTLALRATPSVAHAISKGPAEVRPLGWTGSGCTWAGTWQSRWFSEGGHVFYGDVRVSFDAPTEAGWPATAYYPNGQMSGLIKAVPIGPGRIAWRFEGVWQRTSGNSGGPYQYGEFYLDMTEGGSYGCQFVGKWTYGYDDPRSSTQAWLWQGWG